MEGYAGRIGQLPGSLEGICPEGIPSQSLNQAAMLFGNAPLSSAQHTFIHQRSAMNFGSLSPTTYPNRFLDMHADAEFGIYSLILSSMSLAQRDQLPTESNLRVESVSMANGHNITFYSVAVTAHNLSHFRVQLPTKLGDLAHTFLPSSNGLIKNRDIIFSQTLIAKQIYHMIVLKGIASQYVADLSQDSTFAGSLRQINHALGCVLTEDYNTYLSDNGLHGPHTLGQVLFWLIFQHSTDAICEYRLMLAFLFKITTPSSLGDGARTRHLLTVFRQWIKSGCSTCFMSEILDIPFQMQSALPFTTTSVLDHPSKTYFIEPTYYHVVQAKHGEETIDSASSYWVCYPMYEHSSVYVSTSVGFSILRNGSGTFGVEIPTYLIVTFDLVTTQIVRFVRAAKTGRFYPLVYFFQVNTLEFTTMGKIRDIITVLREIMFLVPYLTPLIRSLVTILYFGAVPSCLTSTAWNSSKDVHREDILMQISGCMPVVNEQLSQILSSPRNSTEHLAILNAPTYTNLLLNTLRAEHAAFCARLQIQ